MSSSLPNAPVSPKDESDLAEKQSRYHHIRHILVTPESIYGTILVSALIGSAEDEENNFEVLVSMLATVLVLWIAHLFAGAIAQHFKRDGEEIPIREAMRRSAKQSSGLLVAAIVPSFVLTLGAVGTLDEIFAYYLALFMGTLVLGFLGWFAFAERGSRWYVCFAGACVTAFLGILVIVLKIIFH